MASAAVVRPASGTALTGYRWPRLAVAVVTGRRSARSGVIWGLVFGLYVYDNAFSFDSIAPTAGRRDALLTAMAGNTGLKALLGDTRGITTLGGFTDWRAIGVITLVASIWGLLTATRALRGEEAAGRWELFLAGQTTARRAAAGALAGLGAGMAVMFLATAALTAVVGANPRVGFGVAQSLLFAAAAVAGAAIFAAVGALASELMATRSRATGLAAAGFGISFLLRALGDATPSAHWLVRLSPLGWVELIHPLTGADPVWLIPIAVLIAGCCVATLLLADRDLGASVLADKDTARPRTALLCNSLLFTVRLVRGQVAAWLAGAILAGLLYGSFARAAGRAFASSPLIKKITGGITAAPARLLQVQGARVYAGVVFLILMTLIMAYVASAVSRARDDEAAGYLDNLLVRRVSRLGWLAGSTALILAVTLVAGVAGGVAFWAGAAAQHSGLHLHELLLAGLNGAVPAVALLGIGVGVLGFAPRLTAFACWGILAWAFLIDMLGSAIKVNHWVMDTSLLRHVALAPAVGPDWPIAGIYLAIGCAAAALGAWRFTRRDLASG